MNRKNALGLDQATDSYYKNNPSSIFPNPAYSWIADKDSISN